MDTESSHLCPECGKPVPVGSPHQLCPACLMAQALASRTLVDGDDDADVPPPLSPEEIAEKFPQFEITECLGRGGMGSVYKARQKSLDRWVAIKILAPEREGRERFAERFAREAQTLARLSHPHIVTIHDFGQTDGLFYLVMEYVDGVNLRELLRDGKIEPEQALAIVPPICDALQYAHDKGVVHRDIKPENLLLDRDGRVKIADFGIASLIGAENESAGTPAYMAPEQADASRKVDHRADIYALGVVLYEMLTGERPGKEVVAPSSRMRGIQIDVRLDEIVLRALEKKPELRFQEASVLKTMVENVSSMSAAPDQQEQTRQGTASSESIQSRKKPTAAASLALGFLLAGIIGGSVLWNILDRQLLILLCGGTLLLALVLGLISRRRPLGKFAAIGSGIALILWAIFSINYVTFRPRQPTYGGLTTSYTPLKKNTSLLAALSAQYDNSKGSGFEIGKRIEVTLDFLNHSPIDIAVNPQELPPTAWLTVTDSNGQQVELDGKNEAASQLKGIRVLKSRDGTVGYTMSLLLLPKNAEATTPKEKADAMAWVEPGRYNLQFHLRLPTASYQRDGAQEDEYRTTPLTIDVTGSPTTGNAVKPSASFGPVLGREMRLGGRLTLCGLDFESGDLFLTEDKSKRMADGQTDRKWYHWAEGWVQSKGVDMFIGGSGDDFGLAGLETQFALQEVPPEAWEAATEAELKKALERFQMWNDEGWAVKKISTNVSVPYTFALRSGDSLGLLQITERLKNPDGIKVRYKLVQKEAPATGPSAPKPEAPHDDPDTTLSNPELIKQLSTEKIVMQGLKSPSGAWTEWQEIEARVEAGTLTKEEGDRIFRHATEWIKREHPDGWSDKEVLYFFGGALETIWKRKLASEPQVLDFLQAFYAKPRIEPIARIREGSSVRMDVILHQEFYRQFLGHQLLNEIRAITVGDRRIEARPLYGRNGHSTNDEDYNAQLLVAGLAPGNYRVKVEMDSTLVTVEDAAKLEVQASPEQWPPARRQWRRACEAELQVLAKDAEIVTLSEDPALNPVTVANLSVQPITIRRTHGKTIAAVTVSAKPPETAPISFGITLKLAGKSYPVGRYFNDGKGHDERQGASEDRGVLTVAIDELDRGITEAELLLTPDPRFIETQPGVARIWGKEIVLRTIPLKRLDLADAQEKPDPTRKRPDSPAEWEKLSNDELIRFAVEKPDELGGPWTMMKKRVETGHFSASDADAWITALIERIRKDPSGKIVEKMIIVPREFAEELYQRDLVVERRILDLLQTLYGDGSVWHEPPSPARPLPGFRFDFGSLWNSHVDRWLGYVLLREVGAITVDGRPVEVRRTEGQLLNAPRYHCELVTGLPPGKHLMECEVFSALVAADNVAGLNDHAPREEWPPLKHRWIAKLTQEFEIPAKEEKAE